MDNIKYYPIELHSHTVHSDGSMTPLELHENAEKFGYSGLFITDHNTMSAHEEIEENKGKLAIPIMKGIEWTTFFGHMLILGCREAGDWTRSKIDNIDEMIERIKGRENAAIGIAHPFAAGSPICTGCHWEFKVENWENIDFIEIYNSPSPQEFFWNKMAYEFWRKKLEEGYRLAITTGRDWHVIEGEGENIPLTYLGIDGDITTDSSVFAIKNGRTYVSLGPMLSGEISQKGNNINLGDKIEENEEISAKIKIKKPEIPSLKNMEIIPRTLRIYNNQEIIIEKEFEYGETFEQKIIPKKGFIRLEVTGQIKEKKDCLLVVTSPVYVK